MGGKGDKGRDFSLCFSLSRSFSFFFFRSFLVLERGHHHASSDQPALLPRRHCGAVVTVVEPLAPLAAALDAALADMRYEEAEALAERLAEEGEAALAAGSDEEESEAEKQA